jgi:hypothetical protein
VSLIRAGATEPYPADPDAGGTDAAGVHS